MSQRDGAGLGESITTRSGVQRNRGDTVARIRTIKPEFAQSESMGRVSRDARLCFLLMWTLADDSGRLRGNSRMLASLLFPYDEDSGQLIEGWLTELEAEACIIRYVTDDNHYVSICNWLKHQKIDKPTPSKLPMPPDSSRVLATPREGSSEDQGRDQGRDQEGSGARASRGLGSGVMGGDLPRHHLTHAFCWRVCVPNFLHGEFRRQAGGPDSDGVVRAFYAGVTAAISDDKPIGEDALKFWRRQFAAFFPTAAPSDRSRRDPAAGRLGVSADYKSKLEALTRRADPEAVNG